MDTSADPPPCSCRSAAARAHGQQVHGNHKNFISCLDGKLQSIPHDRPFFLSSAGHKSTLLLIAPAPAPAPPGLYRNQTLIR